MSEQRGTARGRATTRREHAAVVLGTGALAACSAPGGGAEPAAAGSREVTLRYLMHQDTSEIPTYEGIAQRFTQQLPKVRVAIEPIPWDDYPPKITAMLAGGTPPDACYQASRRVIGFVAAAQTVDLNALLRRDTEAKKEAFWPGTLEENTWRGALFGWPSDAVGIPVAFNRSLLEQRGAKLPPRYVADKGWNWDAVLELGRRVTGDGVFGVPVRDWDGDWPNWIYQNGGEILNKDRTESLIHRPEATEALQHAADLIYRHGVAPPFNQQPWTEGKLALTLAHPNSVQSWRTTLGFDWDIAPLWTRKAAGSTLFTGATTLFKDSPNVPEAWAFAKYFGGPEAERERIVKNGRTPALRSMQDEYVKILDPGQAPASSRLYLESLDYSRPLPITPVWTEMRQIIGEQLKPVWAGEKAARDATAEITRLVNPLLAPRARS
jgi:multiple sugar transport system substrate-binding protein